VNEQGKKLANEIDLPMERDDLISYNSLKRLLNENGLTWSNRLEVIDPHHVWFAGRLTLK